jgi:hypothetical protein
MPSPSAPSPSSPPAAPRPVPLQARLRQWHGAVAPFVLAPLLVTVATGVSYRVLRDWLSWSRDRAHALMVFHEGEWLRQWFGPGGETLYVVLNGLGLLWMLGSGGAMVVQRLQRQWQKRAGVKAGE